MIPHEFVALIAIVVFLILIMIETHVAIAISIAGVVGIVLLDGWGTVTSVLGHSPHTATAKFALFVIPMYVLLGSLISNSNLGERIFNVAARVTWRLPGGLAAATAIATAMFSGISGSSAADVAVFGRVAVGEMARHGYSRSYAAAVVAAAGAFAALIPPSITIIIYAVIAEQSVGALILGAVVPGVLSCLVLAGYLVISATIHRQRSLRAGISVPTSADIDSAELVNSIVDNGRAAVKARRAASGLSAAVLNKPKVGRQEVGAVIVAVLIFIIVAGGIFSGVTTATEAGALGAFVALIFTVIVVRKFGPILEIMRRALLDTARSTSMIFLIIIGGTLFTYSLVLSGVPQKAASWISELQIAPIAIVALMLFMLLPLGTFLDGLSIMLITVPIMAPVVEGLGFSGIWFGILVLKFVEIGLITPPVGINVFVISGIVQEPSERIFRAIVPLILLDIAVAVLIFVFPDIVLWLPRLAGLVM